MSQDEFTKLFLYMQEHFDRIEAELKNKADKDDVNHLYATLDAILKRQETDLQERLVANRQLERHEHWIEKAADKLEISYNPASKLPIRTQ